MGAVLVFGGIAAAAAAFLAGASGFGGALLATPLLLLTGFSLPFIVTINLLTSVVTRISVALRLRTRIDGVRVALLVGGSLPGLYAGARLLHEVDAHAFKLAAGAVTMAGAAAIAALDRREPRGRPLRRSVLAAGFAGGVLGTTTSLLGVPAALLLSKRRLAGAAFMADLALYFVLTSGLGLAVLAFAGTFSGSALWPAFVYWLPGVVAANYVGTTLGLRVPERGFRWATLVLAFTAGAATIATA